MKTRCCLLLALSAVCRAEDSDLKGHVVNVWAENDLFVSTDRHYTHGTRVGYLGAERPWATHGDSLIGRWAGWLPAPWQDTSAWRTGISITQNIYTPRDISIPTVLPDDRPYAGWMYVTPTLERRGLTPGSKTPSFDVWSMNLGVVGPASLSQESQNWIHDLRNFNEAKGWSNQLKNELDLDVRYAKAFRFEAPISGSLHGQFIPHAGMMLGTVQSFASVGAQWRVGVNLPDDFGWRSIDEIIPASGGRAPANRLRRGLYVFMGAEGRAFANNMLLDGNLYHDSHHVEKMPVVGDIRIGMVYVGKRWEIAYTHAIRSKEFRQQQDVDSFGSMSVAFKW